MTNQLENKIVQLVAVDRLYVPTSSLDGKLKRMRSKLAKDLDLSEYQNDFEGERVYARIEEDNKLKARKISEAVQEFSTEYPKYGKILKGIIDQKRDESETHLYFGTNPERSLTSQDYLKVMVSLGFTEHAARRIYPEMMDFSRKLNRKRNEERSILINNED